MPSKKDEPIDHDDLDFYEHSYEDDDTEADMEEQLKNPKS